MSSGVHLRILSEHTGDVNSISFSPDGRTLASGSSRDTVRLWDVSSGVHLRTLTGYMGYVGDISFSPDGQILASSDRLWDVSSGVHLRTLSGHTGRVTSVSFSPDGQTLAGAVTKFPQRVSDVGVWDVSSGHHLRTLSGHTGSVFSVSFSSDGQTLRSSDSEFTRFWDVSSGRQLRSLRAYVYHWIFSVSFSPDGQTLAGAVRDSRASGINKYTIHLWNVSTADALRSLAGHRDLIRCVSFSPNGRTLASGSSDNTVRLWGVSSGVHLRTLSGHTDNVNSVSFSPDGRTLASGSSDGTVRLWDVSSGVHLRTLSGHTRSVNSVSFSPDGQILASGSSDNTILLWDLAPKPTSNTVVSFSPSTVASPGIGGQLTFSLNITAGANVAGYQTTVQFDTTALKFVESSNSDYLPSGAFTIPPMVDGNKIQIGATSLAGESEGDGTLATITFEVVDVKTSTITLSDVLITNSAGDTMTPQIEGAEITEPPQLPEDVNKDGVVNIVDLTLVAANFGATGLNAADVNGDGVVNIVDLTRIAAAFGRTAAAPFILSNNLDVAPTGADVIQWLRDARKLNITDPAFQRGVAVLEQLLAALTPKETALLPNYPNPFNPETWIPYQLAKPVDVSISIYAANGQLVRTLDLGHQPVGIYNSKSHAAYWDGKNALGEPVASGVYFYTLTAEDFTATRKMLIRK